MASPVYLWFTKEVQYWRTLAASLWAIICLPVLIFVASLIFNISLTHPLAWTTDAVADLLSLRFAFTLLVFTIAVLTVTWFSLPYYCVKQDFYSSRLSCVLSLLRWTRLPLLVIFMLNGAVCAWSVARFTGSYFTVHVDTDEYEKTVLNEACLFTVGCGMFTGFCCYWQFFTQQEYFLRFPSIWRQRVFQVRSESKIMAGKIAWRTLHVLKYYYILYLLFGSLPRSWVYTSFGISEDTDASPLDSIIGMLNLSLLWKTYLTSFLITFAFSFSIVLTKIFHTEHLEFPVTTLMEFSSERTLSNALACTYSPLLRHLAFYDLACLSKFMSPRLQEVLSLSQPGGHPKVWMSVSSSALSIIRELTSQVKEENWSVMSRVPISTHRNGVANGNSFYTPYGSSGEQLNSSCYYRGEVTKDDDQILREEPERPSFMSQLTSKLSSMPILSQFLAQSNDVNSRRLFASCQMHIWAVESMSHIAVRAYAEDKYGVVQGTLPLMFLTLLELHESLEKHFKLCTSPRRPNGSMNASTDCVIRYKLQSVLKASLYRMVNTYKPHLEDMKLNPEEIKKLIPFVHYTL